MLPEAATHSPDPTETMRMLGSGFRCRLVSDIASELLPASIPTL